MRRPIGRKTPAAAVSIFRLMANPLRTSQTLFGANTYTFTFWPNCLWFLSTADPLYTTDHLHERLVERASKRRTSLAETQDSLSILWPTLIALGQQRRQQGLRANVTNFVTPLTDGLIFGDMQRFEMSEDVAEAAAPTVVEFSNALGLEKRLCDFFSNGHERLMVCVRTYVHDRQLKEVQRRLKVTLDRYIRRHRPVLDCMRDRTRLAFDAEAPYGQAHRDLFVSPQPTTAAVQAALTELDAITSSDDWRDEIKRSTENRCQRSKAS
jgi:hypothetical protein